MFSFRSNRKASNLGTFYFKHTDTDSDREKVTSIMSAKRSLEYDSKSGDTESDKDKINGNHSHSQSIDDTSDDEWIYSEGTNGKAKMSEDVVDSLDTTLKPSIKKIHRLVEKAEELVSPVKRNLPVNEPPINKITRVKQWLNMDKPDDSCDASGEDEERESHTSEDLTESIVTYRAAVSTGVQDTSASFMDLVEETSTPKNVLRPRNNLKSNRPWSVSCISQLSHSTRRLVLFLYTIGRIISILFYL